MKINTPVKGWLNPRLWFGKVWLLFDSLSVAEEEAKRLTRVML
tara:strand:+ start:1471 stop:1599 length:129 start_codon:yes stop_codon:yes gene_type:complete